MTQMRLFERETRSVLRRRRAVYADHDRPIAPDPVIRHEKQRT